MPVAAEDLWSLVVGRPQVDADRLADALVRQVGQAELDYRTRLLIHDSLAGLLAYWGVQRYGKWLAECQGGPELLEIAAAEFGSSGFPSLRERIMDSTKAQSVLAFLRELGLDLNEEASIEVGGSVALILSDLLSRHTEDIDVVDEVPPAVRRHHELLEALARRYGLRLAHFQSHYLPEGWRQRLRSLGAFGKLNVWLVDPMDIFVGKLFSAREKDRDDLRVLSPRLDREKVADRLRTAAKSLLSDPRLKAQARDNWYILFGEELPAGRA